MSLELLRPSPSVLEVAFDSRFLQVYNSIDQKLLVDSALKIKGDRTRILELTSLVGVSQAFAYPLILFVLLALAAALGANTTNDIQQTISDAGGSDSYPTTGDSEHGADGHKHEYEWVDNGDGYGFLRCIHCGQRQDY